MDEYERNTMNNTIRRLAERQAAIDSRPLPKASTKREKSSGEAMAEYHQPDYYLYFCFHDKSIFEICTACHRTKKDAKRNLESL